MNQEKDNIELKPIVEEKDNTESKLIVEDKDNTETKPIVEDKDNTESKPIVEDKDNTELRPIVEDKDETELKTIIEKKVITELDPFVEKKVFSYIGLAAKGGKLVCGEFMSEKIIKAGKAKLVIVAGDASKNTQKMFTNMCAFYKVPLYLFGDKDKLGHAMGKEFRASLVLLDKGLADVIEKQLNIIKKDECIEETCIES